MIKIQCGDKIRCVKDIHIVEPLGCSLVNNGHDDLFDLGFRHDELEEFGLIITVKNESKQIT